MQTRHLLVIFVKWSSFKKAGWAKAAGTLGVSLVKGIHMRHRLTSHDLVGGS